MSTFLPREVQLGLEAARKQALRMQSTLSVHVGKGIHPILKFSDGLFSVDAEVCPKLRGLVDIYDGDRHLYQALIMSCRQAGGEWVFEFKRNTMAADRPVLDFWIEPDAPKGLLAAD